MSRFTFWNDPAQLARARTATTAGLACVAALFLGLVIAGAVRWYSPIPFWDMWDGYLLYYINSARNGFWSHIFDQANEHRDVLSRLLFWLDIRFFGGRSLLLIPVNVALVVAGWLALCAAARRLLPERSLWVVVCLGIAPLCFSWLQKDNIVVGYQSQFFFAYLVPLLAFMALAASFGARRPAFWFIAALALGLASLGSMANGLLTIPLLVVMLCFAKANRWWIALAALCGILATLLWFQGYVFFDQPRPGLVDIVLFVLSFLGAPFAGPALSETLARCAGVLFICLSLGLAIHWWRGRRDPETLALLTFIAYVGASTLATALGRAGFIQEVTREGRYATPALLAWAALAIVLAGAFKPVPGLQARFTLIGFLVAAFLLPAQVRALDSNARQTTFEKARGALALTLGVKDLEAVASIYHVAPPQRVDEIFAIADFADDFGVSIFSQASGYVPARGRLGRPVGAGLHTCDGNVEAVEDIQGQGAFRLVSGWAFDRAHGAPPSFVYFASEGIVTGVGVTGLVRPDVSTIIGRRASRAGFKGYVMGASAPEMPLWCADE